MSENADGPSRNVSALGREPRSGRVFVATLSSDRLREQPIVVRNLSSYGISARLQAGEVEPGECVMISLNGEAIAAEVRWVRKGRFGARLAREIDPSAFNFTGRSWENVVEPLGPGHVFDQYKPVTDFRRPGLKTR